MFANRSARSILGEVFRTRCVYVERAHRGGEYLVEVFLVRDKEVRQWPKDPARGLEGCVDAEDLNTPAGQHGFLRGE